MIPEYFKIPLSTVFAHFLAWFIINLVHQFTTFKNAKFSTFDTVNNTTTVNDNTTAHHNTAAHLNTTDHHNTAAHLNTADNHNNAAHLNTATHHNTVTHHNATITFGNRVAEANRTLLDSLYLLSIGVIINMFMYGNRTAIDTFSLISLFSAALSALSFLAGVRIAGKALWVLFLLSILGLFITAFATPAPNWNSAVNPIFNTSVNE